MTQKPSGAATDKSIADKKKIREAHQKLTNAQATRETVESIVIAVILAFLFRTFVAEAFVIPTGSMASTLQGNHKDITCEKCNYQYQASASAENDGNGQRVVGATCPICRYQVNFDPKGNAYHQTFTGDRILVNKFSYDLDDPERWDVIVFKFPENAKQNYIKRLIGLPNELIHIYRGDIFVKGSNDQDFKIARKPPHKIKAMLQLVDEYLIHRGRFEKSGVAFPLAANTEVRTAANI